MTYVAFHDSILADLLNGYLANPALSWRNTLLTDTAPQSANGWSAADLAGSMFYRIYHDYGLDSYKAFWRALAKQPTAITTDDTIRDFLAAAKAATGRNYGFLFKDTFSVPGSTPPGRVGLFRSGFFWLEDVDGNHQFNSPPDWAFAFGGVAGDIPISGIGWKWHHKGRSLPAVEWAVCSRLRR